MLTKEPEMLQPDVFCEHTTRQRPGLPRDSAGGSSPDHLSGFNGAASQRGGEGNEGEGRGGEGKRKREAGREEREGRLTLMRSWNTARPIG